MTAAVLIAVLLPPTSPAAAVGTMTIAGHTLDNAGRPVAGVRVSDGQGGSTTSNSSGAYSLSETFVSTYVVTASKPGLVGPGPRVVGPVEALSPVDFAMTYVLTGSISPRAFSITPPTDLSLSATTYAPVTDLCVRFTDSAAGSTAELSRVGAGVNPSSWAGIYTVPTGLADGAYGYTIKGVLCSTGVTLTQVAQDVYILDRVAPIVSPVAPVDGGNAFFPQLRIVADARDELSGIDPSTPTIQLVDRGMDNATVVSSTSVPAIYVASSNTVGALNDVALTPGHYYEVAVGIRDYAGNQTTRTEHFAAATITIPSAKASIPDTAASDGGKVCSFAFCTWEFTGLALTVGGYDVELSNTNHSGFGSVDHGVSLGRAVVSYSLLGISRTQFLDDVATSSAAVRRRTVSQQLATLESGPAPQTLHVNPLTVVITDDIVVSLPQGVTDVRLSLTSIDVPPIDRCRREGDATFCANDPNPEGLVQQTRDDINGVVTQVYQRCRSLPLPSNQVVNSCNPDYLTYFASDEEAQQTKERDLQISQDAANDIDVTLCGGLCLQALTAPDNPVFNSSIVNNLSLDPLYEGWVDPFSAVNIHVPLPTDSISPESLQRTATDGVAYPPGYPGVATGYFALLCLYSYSCDRSSASTTATNNPVVVPVSSSSSENKSEVQRSVSTPTARRPPANQRSVARP